MSDLTFDQLRAANVARLSQFTNSRGFPAHSKPDGSDWSPSQWLQAVVGELGEYANLMKKVERGDFLMAETLPKLADELADVQIYLDLLAFRIGVDLGAATVSKWNVVAERIGCELRLLAHGSTVATPAAQSENRMNIDDAVNRFLSWELPRDFAPDGGINFTPHPPYPHYWPVGTNLFTANQAKAMLEYVLATPAEGGGSKEER